MKQLISLLFVFGLNSNLIASDIDTVTVATATEFTNSIQSNRVILLTNHIELSNEKFILKDIFNLKIIGNTKNQIKITTNNSGNSVIVLKECKHVTLTNLSIGHWPDVGYCSGNVLDIEKSDDVSISNCDLFGSGVVGLNLYYSTVWCYNTTIRDCSENIIKTNEYHSSLIFDNCIFYLNQNNTVEYRAPRFINCTFYDVNKKLIYDKYNGYYPNKPIKIQAEIVTEYPAWKGSILYNGEFEADCPSSVKIEASSFLKNTIKNNSYNPENMYDANIFDNKEIDAWVEGVKGYGIGEKITFTTASVYSKKGEEWPLTSSYTIINGYAKNKAVWENNAKVQQFKVFRNNKLVAYVNLLDTPNVQSFNLDDIIIKNNLTIGETIAFEITKVYKGKKYNDTAITYFSPNCIP